MKSRVSLSIRPSQKAQGQIPWNSQIYCCISVSLMSLYQVELPITSRHIFWYWWCAISTMFPPLSDRLMIVAGRFCCLIRACVCFLFKFVGISDHFCFLSVLTDSCRKARIAGQVIRSGNFPYLNLNFFCCWSSVSTIREGTETFEDVGRGVSWDETNKSSFSEPSSYRSIRSRSLLSDSNKQQTIKEQMFEYEKFDYQRDQELYVWYVNSTVLSEINQWSTPTVYS